MHRLFAACAVPDEIAARLLPLRADLPGVHWRRREHFHVTLHFYGEVHRELAEAIAEGLDRVGGQALELHLEGVGWFGRKAPHTLYARIADDDALARLAGDCRKLARRLGLQVEARPFVPHVTLAYCNEVPLDLVRTWSENFQLLRSDRFFVETFHLYESFTSPGRQSRYQAQADYRLDG